jgi:FKBP-type peptidyl-prolyl cis-trans isomerase FkpA
MRKLSLLFIAAMLTLAACNSQREEVTSRGMKYTVVKTGDGRQPKTGEWVVFDFVLKNDKDSVLRSTYTEQMPAANFVQDTMMIGYHGAIPEMLSQVKVGDSIHLKLTMDEFFKYVAGGRAPTKADSSSLFYAIKIQDVKTATEFDSYRYEVVTKRDDKTIQDYLKTNNINAEQDTSGLRYVIHNQTGNKKPAVTDCIEIKYDGRMLQNGRSFDAGTITMPLSNMIYGWQIGIPKLSEGDSATLYVPSRLGYGPRGQGRIPPDAILVFDVTLLHVKEYDQQTNSCK